MATTNSRPPAPPFPEGIRRGLWVVLGCLVCFQGTFDAGAADAPRVTAVTPRPQRVYDEARARCRKETNSVEAAWQLGRATFGLAEVAVDDAGRAALANEGIGACRRAITLDPASAAAHYYLGLNYGQLAQTKLLGALKLVEQMEAEWKITVRIDPKYDYAGGYRTLGILYRDAPGWPTSIGSRAKSRQQLLKAQELQPDYPGNRLTLYESYAKWGEKKLVQDHVAATEEFLNKARARLFGEEWALDWEDWNKRWESIKVKCSVVTVRSPRESR